MRRFNYTELTRIFGPLFLPVVIGIALAVPLVAAATLVTAPSMPAAVVGDDPLDTPTATATLTGTQTITATASPVFTYTSSPTVTATPPFTGTAEAKVTICHHTGSSQNPYVEITVSTDALPAHAAHGDIIPAPAGGCPAAGTPGPSSTAGASSPTSTPTAAPSGTPAASATTTAQKITICHATGSTKNPYVLITIDVDGLNGHSNHPGDIIPAPASGCPATSQQPAKVAPPGNGNGNGNNGKGNGGGNGNGNNAPPGQSNNSNGNANGNGNGNDTGKGNGNGNGKGNPGKKP